MAIHIWFSDDFKESEHPRADNGQFGSGSGAGNNHSKTFVYKGNPKTGKELAEKLKSDKARLENISDPAGKEIATESAHKLEEFMKENNISVEASAEETKKEAPKTTSKPKTYLKVPYAEKELAKSKGARWDAAAKSWYIPEGYDVPPALEKYAPKISTEKANTSAGSTKSSAMPNEYHNLVNEGGEGYGSEEAKRKQAEEKNKEQISEAKNKYAEFLKEWTPEVTKKRREAWNSYAASLGNKSVPISEIQNHVGFSLAELKQAIAEHKQ